MDGLMYLPLAYLLGAIPTAYLIGFFLRKGDIRKIGSGNVGGMNIYRTAGLLPGLITVTVDMGKGVLAVVLIGAFTEGGLLFSSAAALFAVLGHNFNIFLGFRGGKGLATAFGAFLVFSPPSILYVIPPAILLTFVLKDINTAFGAAAMLIPFAAWIVHDSLWAVFICALIAAAIAAKHFSDFKAYRGGRRKILRGWHSSGRS